MKENDKKRIQEALNAGKSAAEVQVILQKLVRDEVLPIVSNEHRYYWESVCNTVQFPLKLKSVTMPIYIPVPQITKFQLPWRKYAGVVTVAAVFLVAEKMSEDRHLSNFLLSLVSGVIVEHFANPVLPSEQQIVETKIVVESTISEIEDYVCRFVEDIRMLEKDPYPLENRHSQVLEWMQNVYLDAEEYGEECAKFFRKRVESTMQSNGYELVFYSENNKNCFEIEKSRTVKGDFQMVLPAIRNVKTNNVILKGKTFLPMV